jgi:hypothetical protein
MQSVRDASEALETAAKMAELTKANALLLAEIQRATVERDTLLAATPGGPGGTKALVTVSPTPQTHRERRFRQMTMSRLVTRRYCGLAVIIHFRA